MKNTIFILLLICLLPVSAIPQNDISSLKNCFEEIKLAAEKNISLWNSDLYGPVLFVDEVSRTVYANEPDSSGILKLNDGIYTGTLPKEVNTANTSMEWGGKLWAMILLPLPSDKNEMLNLCTHELFHRIQNKLGFKTANPDNPHLDEKDGRIYLRLELTALVKSLLADSRTEMKKHILNALIFRKYRNSIYDNSAESENLLELNEGIAEYTGTIMSGMNFETAKKYIAKQIEEFFKVKTFVRSFPYRTIPAYGILLSLEKKDWNLVISQSTNLTDFFIMNFGLQIPQDLKAAVEKSKNEYGYEKILKEENDREYARKKLEDDLTRIFTAEPHLDLNFVSMRISFNPGNIIPLKELGTVYPTLRVSDAWGILEVKETGGLISQDWTKVTVSGPSGHSGNTVYGKGWTLELNENYTILKNESGNYILKKKQ